MRRAWIYYHLGHQNRYEHVISQLGTTSPNESNLLEDNKLARWLPSVLTPGLPGTFSVLVPILQVLAPPRCR